jgi:YD repeat-containing protein
MRLWQRNGLFVVCVFGLPILFLLGALTTSHAQCPSDNSEAEVDNDDGDAPSDPPTHKCICTDDNARLKAYEANLMRTLRTGKLGDPVWAWKRERFFYPWGGVVAHDPRLAGAEYLSDPQCPKCGVSLVAHDDRRVQQAPSHYYIDRQCQGAAAGKGQRACYEAAGNAAFSIKGRFERLPALPYIKHREYPYALGGATLSLSLGRGEGAAPASREIPATRVAGMLCLSSYEPGAHMSQPEGLSLWMFNVGVEEVRDESRREAIRQVMAPDCLVDITVTNEHQYAITFYNSHEVEAELDKNGFYVPTGDPVVRYTVSDPDEGENGYKRLFIREERGCSVVAHEYEWNDEPGGWEYTHDDIRYTVPTTITDIGPLYHKEIRDANNVLVSRVDEQWGLVCGEYGAKDVIFWQAVDPDGLNLRTYYSYYTNYSDYMRFEKVRERINPDGSRIGYEYDDIGRLTKKEETWQDATDTRVTYYSYASVDNADELQMNYMSPRTITEYVNGEIVGKTFYVF